MRMNKRISYVVAVCLIASCVTNTVSYAYDVGSIQENSTYASAMLESTTAPTATPTASPDMTSTMAPDATSSETPSVLSTNGSTATPDPALIEAPSGTPDAETAVTPSPEASAAPSVTPSLTPDLKPTPKPEDAESLWYREKLPLKKEHQKLLWDYCKARKLDYIDMLALMSLESSFKEKSSSGKHKGYFQISTAHAANLSKTLKTLNKPLDGAININWGTAFYSWILADKRVKNIEDAKKKRDVALSIYQRGSGGYDKYGLSTRYLKRFYQKKSIVSAYFEDKAEKK